MPNNFHQGIYEVKNKKKYLGKDNPRFLSSYEYHFFEWADRSENVIQWAAEQVIVEYHNPVKERKARYIVDVYMKYRNQQGKVVEEIIEIKPFAQTKKPKRGRKRPDVFEREVATYITNMAKWEAAQRYADARGWGFRVVTEKSIFYS